MLLLYRFLEKTTASTRPPPDFADRPKQSMSLAGKNSTTAGPTMVLACSSLSQQHHDLIYANRKLCEDRRGVFDHLRPRLFVKNTIRIVVMRSTTVVTHYYNDQLKEDMDREERIQRGEITRAQANREDEEWQEVSTVVFVPSHGWTDACLVVGCRWILSWETQGFDVSKDRC